MNVVFLEEDQRKFIKGTLKGNFSPTELRRRSSENGVSMDHEKRLQMRIGMEENVKGDRNLDGDLYSEWFVE